MKSPVLVSRRAGLSLTFHPDGRNSVGRHDQGGPSRTSGFVGRAPPPRHLRSASGLSLNLALTSSIRRPRPRVSGVPLGKLSRKRADSPVPAALPRALAMRRSSPRAPGGDARTDRGAGGAQQAASQPDPQREGLSGPHRAGKRRASGAPRARVCDSSQSAPPAARLSRASPASAGTSRCPP